VFVRTSIHRELHEIRADAAMVEQRVPLTRRPIAGDSHTGALAADEEFDEIVTRHGDLASKGQALVGVVGGDEDNQSLIAENFRHFADKWVNQPAFVSAYRNLSDEDFVARVYANAGLKIDEAAQATDASELKEKRVTRAEVLLKLVDDAAFVSREKNRSLVLLHFFGYLRRNPDDPPDNNMNGLLHWVIEMDKGYAPAALSYAFASSIEHQRILQQAQIRPARDSGR